jgi:uncharacterized protein (TIGR04255 family)
MASKIPASQLMPLVEPNDGQYRRNFTRQVVCEFRFPTLLSFGDPQPPKALVSALRKQYPVLELGKEVSIGLGESGSPTLSHILKSPKLTWQVALKKESLSIETSRYVNYKEFRSRVAEVLQATIPLIDSDFFTRVGLRYVNVVTTDGKMPLSDWINPALVGIVEQHGFSGINELAGRLRLQGDDGGCFLQHGVKPKEPSPQSEDDSVAVPDYILDIDTYRDEVMTAEALSTLDGIRIQAYSMFQWAIGQRAKDYLKTDRKKD